VLHALQENGVSLSTPVAEIWPEFARGGKEAITLAMLLSHQAGLVAIDTQEPLLDYERVVHALAKQVPLWPPGAGHGYHARTFGFLLDEIVRRLNGGLSLGHYWQRNFAEPLGLDFWIGLPADRVESAATVYPARFGPSGNDPFQAALADAASLSARAFASPSGLNRVSAMNSTEARTASLPALGGIGTARALARFYAMLATGGELDGRGYFTEQTLRWMKTPLVNGPDKVLCTETSFSAGFMKDPTAAGAKTRGTFGPSLSAFGHPGAGGSLAFADPENDIAFAYVMNQMEPGVMSNPKAARLVAALYA
jgi:CubicO group peptidase (beta-lactamase class C family)